MPRRPSRAVPPLMLCLVLVTANPAGSEPARRGGVFVGLGLGAASASWVRSDRVRHAEWSAASTLRAGFAIHNELLLGLELWGWAGRQEPARAAGPAPAASQLIAAALAATYFPGDFGAFVRGGIGAAEGRVELSPPATTLPASGEIRKMGFAAVGGIGYEWRVTPRFALGGEGDVVYLSVGEAIGPVFAYGATVQFNWYW